MGGVVIDQLKFKEPHHSLQVKLQLELNPVSNRALLQMWDAFIDVFVAEHDTNFRDKLPIRPSLLKNGQSGHFAAAGAYL